MKEITKKYVKDDLTITWKPHLCIHSAKCFNGLPEVFNPRVHPWITPEGSTAEEIISQINMCPSGALSYTQSKQSPKMENTKVHITVLDKGPYLVKGNFIIVDTNGNEEEKEGNVAFCRCGLSNNKPFCDGTHRTTDVLTK